MASLKREEEFRINHKKYKDLVKHFHIAFWLAEIPSLGAFLMLALFYAIRGLALLSGADLVLAQKILNDELGTNDSSGLTFNTPYLYMTFLFIIGVGSLIAFFFRLRKPHRFLFAVYLAGALYGLICMFTGNISVLAGLYLMIYGMYGMWLEDFILRLHKELDELSLKEGFPDFIEAINEPRPMANTSGLHYHKSELIKRQQKENKDDPESIKNIEMDTLDMNTPVPKSSRKIDSLMFIRDENGKDIQPEINEMDMLDPNASVHISNS